MVHVCHTYFERASLQLFVELNMPAGVSINRVSDAVGGLDITNDTGSGENAGY